MPIENRIRNFHPEMILWRRDIHAHPEMGFAEHRTSQLVAQRLESWGIEVTRGIAGTGLVGTLRSGTGARSIGLRADMDALPMTEHNQLDYASTTPGCMHACGHDGHSIMLLGAAKYLAETRRFDGTVHFIFQPAEEGGGGAQVMINQGLFARFPVDAVYGLHNDPGLPLGRGSVVSGPVQAASDSFVITVNGKGGHAARPHLAIDPLLIGAHIVVALQSIVSRRLDVYDTAVLSVTQFHAGEAENVISDRAQLSGTVRTVRLETQDQIESLLKSVATTTAAAHGGTATVDYKRRYPVTINHAAEADRAAAALVKVLGEDNVIRKRPPVMGAEDFSFMLLARPGCFLRLGQAAADKGNVPLHNSKYDFNDDLLPIGASFFAALVEQELVAPTGA